jgi:hypothetical protein
MDQSLRLNKSTLFTLDSCRRRYLIGSSLDLLVLFLYVSTSGTYPIPVETALAAFLHRFHLVDKTRSDAIDLVVLNVRAPPIAAATLMEGVNLRAVQELVGHVDIRMTACDAYLCTSHEPNAVTPVGPPAIIPIEASP